MNLGISLEILAIIITTEISLMVILLISTYILKYLSYHKLLNLKKKKKEMENHLRNLIDKKLKLDPNKIPRKYKQINILIPVLIKLDETYNSSVWEFSRNELINTIILPLAREKYSSRNWLDRFFSAKAFHYSQNKEDSIPIDKLTQDKITLVFVHAIVSAVNLKAEKAINQIITRLSTLYWLTQLFYLKDFEDSDSEIRNIVTDRLQHDNNPLVRALCYKILTKCPLPEIELEIERDLHHDDFNLRLAVIKYLFYVNKSKAIPIALSKVNDDHWEVRLVIVHRLGIMKLPESIPALINCLHDTNWWVRISAAEALKNFGEDGVKLIQEHAKEFTNIPFKSSDHIPHAFW